MMTFALASHVVVQSVDPERGDEEAELPTALLAETAPCAAPSSNRHQSQVAVTARRCQPAPASLYTSQRSLRSVRCSRVPRGGPAPPPPSRPRWRAPSRCPSSPFSTIRCPSRSPVGCCPDAARRRGASRRRQRRPLRRSSAAARTGRLRRTARASPELAAFEACVKAPHERLDEALKKSGACLSSRLRALLHASVRASMRAQRPKRGLHVGMRLVR